MGRSIDRASTPGTRPRAANALGRVFIPALIAASLPVSVASAQVVGVELRFETQVLELGETIGGQLVCTNTGEPRTPRYSVPPGLDLQFVRPTPSPSSFTSIINGRRTQRTTYTYSMRLTGLKEGTYTLGPMIVEASTATYQTAPVRITVRDTQDSTEPEGDKLAFVRVSAEPASLYVTEAFQATLTFGIRKIYINGRKIDYDDQLLQTIDANGSEFSVFGYRFNASEASLVDSTGARHEYMVYRQTQDVKAEEIGQVRVGPIFLKVNYPTAFRRGFFGRLEPSRTQRVTARADAAIVKVKGPPAQLRPDDFAGAIGRYTMRASVKPTRVEQGRPVTLAIAIGGRPIEGVAGPDLNQQAELASRFDYAGDELTGDVERDGLKVFRRAIFPKQQGEQTVPPISWSYFDPRSEQYVTLTSDPLPLTVDPPAAGTTPTQSFEEDTMARGAGLTLLHGGISPNYVDPEKALVSQSFVLTGPTAAATLALPPVLYCLVALAARYRSRLKGDVAFARKRRALHEGRRLAARAMRDGDPGRQMHGLSEAITTYVAHRFDLPPGELTPRDVRELLVSSGQSEATVDEIADFLVACDALRYAPGAAGQMSPAKAAAKVRGWMNRIERGA